MKRKMIPLWRNDKNTGIERVISANRSDSCEQRSCHFIPIKKLEY